MGVPSDRSEFSRKALENARRVAERLRRHEQDLAQKMPDEARGGEALRTAVAAAECVARLLEASGTHGAASHPDP
jgi:hypothetical protein